MKSKILLLQLIFVLTLSYSQINSGFINIRDIDFDISSPIKLSGDWIVTYPDGRSIISKVPADWEGDEPTVTYTLRIESQKQDLILAPTQINSSYVLLLNGVELVREDSYRFLYVPVTLKDGVNRLDLVITNTTDPVGGIRNSPLLGSHIKMRERQLKTKLRDGIFAGANIIVAIFFIILYFYYKRDRSSIYFALLCIALAIRGVVINDKILFLYIDNLSGTLIQRLEYFSVYSLPLLFMLFIKTYFNYSSHRLPFIILAGLTIPFPISVVFLPPLMYKSVLFIYFIFAIITILFIVFTLAYYIYKRMEDSVKIFVSLLIIGLAAISDISIVLFNRSETHILSIVLMIFILYMIYNIFSTETRKLLKRSELTNENIQVNRYLHKFVPSKYIKSIGLGDTFSISDGDGIDREMTILFSSIKGFQNEFALHQAEDGIKLLNRVFSIISPIFTKHNGLIDKFMDESIMVLFPEDPQDAIRAIMEVNSVLEGYNRTNPTLFPIELYTGIHIGPCHFGIVGDGKRSDITVISPTVNKASRIHSFAEKIDQSILISDALYKIINIDSEYNDLYMGKVKLKGNRDFVGIYTLFTHNITQADNLFSMTMRKLENSSLYDIESVLQRIKTIHRTHKPSNYYLDLINKNRKLEELEK